MGDSSVLLDKMSGFEFEELVAEILKRLGYGTIERILFTQDEGRDILVRSDRGLIVVECKHQPRSRIGRPVVQKLHSAVLTSQATKGILVTTGRFTVEAVGYAEKLAQSGNPIEMVDRPILTDMASRAGIRIVSGGENLNVWTYVVPSELETDRAVAEYLDLHASSMPHRPHELMHNGRRALSYRPLYVVTYNVQAVFETTVGIIHTESVRNASITLDGNNGQLYEDQVIDFLRTEEQIEFDRGSENLQGDLPSFRIDHTTLQRAARTTIRKIHAREVTYWGRNNQKYSKVCEPGERDVYISDIRQLYLPFFRLQFQLINTHYHVTGVQAPSGRLLPLEDNLTCKICGETPQKRIICDVCGKVTHKGGFLLGSIHGFECRRCHRTTCRDHGYWRRRLLLLKELVCPTCREEGGTDGRVYKLFEPIGGDPAR